MLLKHRNNESFIFEVGQVFVGSMGNQLLRSLGFGEIFYELESCNAVHATKEEKIKYYEDKIKEQQVKLKKAKAIKDDPVWPLSGDTDHWIYGFSGRINRSTGQFLRGTSNQALSEKRAEQLFEKSKLMQDMYLWADTFCPDWEPNWGNMSKNKWGISTSENRTYVDIYSTSNFLVFGISVPTEELAEKMLVEFGDRIKEWY